MYKACVYVHLEMKNSKNTVRRVKEKNKLLLRNEKILRSLRVNVFLLQYLRLTE